MKFSIELEELKELLDYNFITGHFTWKKKRPNHSYVGKRAGSFLKPKKSKTSYRIITVNLKFYQEHRLAWFYMTGEWPVQQIDHINQDGTCNTWINLREATPSQNIINRKLQKNNASGYTGVRWHHIRKKWIVHINSKKGKYVGFFDNLQEAITKHKLMCEKIYGVTF